MYTLVNLLKTSHGDVLKQQGQSTVVFYRNRKINNPENLLCLDIHLLSSVAKNILSYTKTLMTLPLKNNKNNIICRVIFLYIA